MSTTVREIALMADVSIATVSRALHYEPGVGPDCAAKVRAIAQKLNYSAPGFRPVRRRLTTAEATAAQPLRGRTIAMVVLGMERSLSALPVVADALHGVESGAAAAGGALVFIDCPDMTLVPAALETQPLAGVILVGAYEGNMLIQSGSELLEKLRELPAVWLLGRPSGIEWGDSVGADNAAVGRIAADYLLSRGHRHLAFVSSVRMPEHPIVTMRQWSFESRARAAGGSVQLIDNPKHPAMKLPLPATTLDEVEPLVDQWLALSPRPTGIFTAFDSLTVLLHRCLTRRGVVVGRDLEIVSCNNERSLIEPLEPAVATIDVAAHEIGRKAVEMLAWRRGTPASGSGAGPMSLSLTPRLVAARN